MEELILFIITTGLLVSLFFKSLKVRVGIAALALILLLIFGFINFIGLAALIGFTALTFIISNGISNKVIRVISAVIWVFAALALIIHAVPGINNYLVYPETELKPNSLAIPLYWNIDKLFVGWAICTFLTPLWQRSTPHSLSIIKVIFLGLATIATTILVAYLYGVIQLQLIFMPFLLITMFLNITITSFTEEALFRGVIQKQFIKWTPSQFSPYWAIVLTSLLFGLAHLPFSMGFAIAAVFAGLGYGLIYFWGGRLCYAVLLHGVLNVCHMIGFSYPLLV